jgi:Xaa-Pro dipeptidase
MRPDHAYSIEPGTYIPNKTEYRHSNAILSIEDGAEQITDYSRGLEENIIRW